MLFSSSVFLFLFLPGVLIVYYLFLRRWRQAQNIFLLLASLVFYAWGEPWFVLVMMLSIAANYGFGLWVARGQSAGTGTKAPVLLAAVFNLSVLFVFKYLTFTLGILNRLGGAFVIPGIELPIGISFFTFQALSYVLDVQRGRGQAQRSPLKVGLYISFFPQLIAGPIVIYHDVADQIDRRELTPELTLSGLRRFILGFGKKILLANSTGEIADAVFAMTADQLDFRLAWLGAVCYTLQIYFDFSGYSDMAIGLGRMFGFRFLENFNLPYASKSIKEFWRRWHISLSSWFRDYLYIPLGGNRKGAARTNLNKFIVFFATGLWHGANWSFVLWGLWHGLFSTLEGIGVIPRRLRESRLGHVYTMLVVILGFTLFRADTLADAGVMFTAMFTGFSMDPANTLALIALLDAKAVFLLVTAPLFAFGVPQWVWRQLQQRGLPQRAGAAAAAVGYSALFGVSVLTLAGATFNPFIYFQF